MGAEHLPQCRAAPPVLKLSSCTKSPHHFLCPREMFHLTSKRDGRNVPFAVKVSERIGEGGGELFLHSGERGGREWVKVLRGAGGQQVGRPLSVWVNSESRGFRNKLRGMSVLAYEQIYWRTRQPNGSGRKWQNCKATGEEEQEDEGDTNGMSWILWRKL